MEPQPTLEPLKRKPSLPSQHTQDEIKKSQSTVQAVHGQLENKFSYEDFYPARIQTKKVDIGKIEHSEHVLPDYKEPLDLLWPVVITNTKEDTHHCIDGWPLIEKAHEEGEESVECDVHYVHCTGISIF